MCVIFGAQSANTAAPNCTLFTSREIPTANFHYSLSRRLYTHSHHSTMSFLARGLSNLIGIVVPIIAAFKILKKPTNKQLVSDKIKKKMGKTDFFADSSCAVLVGVRNVPGDGLVPHHLLHLVLHPVLRLFRLDVHDSDGDSEDWLRQYGLYQGNFLKLFLLVFYIFWNFFQIFIFFWKFKKIFKKSFFFEM